jgi:Spy/CpxP family protein refolding chaperone
VNNWKVIPTIVLATVLIFGAGVFTGGMLVNHVKQSRPKVAKKVASVPAVTNVAVVALPTNSPNVKQPKPPEILSKDFLQRLEKELHLNAVQHESVRKIINEGQDQMRRTLQVARLEIREVLDPEQLKQFDELMKRSFKKPIFSTNSLPPPVQNPPVTNAP